MNTNGPLFTPFLLSIMAAPWPQLLSAPLCLPWNIHYTMNHVQTAGRAAPVYPAPRSQMPKSLFTLILRRAFGLHAVSPHALLAPHTRLFFCCTILAMIFHLIWANDIFFWAESWPGEKKKTILVGEDKLIAFCFWKSETVSAPMSCAHAAHFVASVEILLRRCQKSWSFGAYYVRRFQKSNEGFFARVKYNFVYFPAD